MNAIAASASPVTKADAPDAPAKADGKPAKDSDFSKQLQSATEKTDPKTEAKPDGKTVKTAAKKPVIDLGDATSITQPPPATDSSALAQIIAAILNGTATATATATPTGDAEPADPKVALAAAIEKATTTDTANPEINAIVEQMVAVKPEVAPQLAPAQPPLTPLEQAVHDMLSDLAEKKQAAPDAATAMQGVSMVPQQTSLAPIDVALEIQHAAPIMAQQPQELVSQNHAHLVFDDPNGRVVMTVAVRGNDVNVTMRASDDSTAAALARNAGSLDEAMRGRGLSLAQFDSQRDLAREQNRDKPAYEQRDKQSKQPAFTLEEST